MFGLTIQNYKQCITDFDYARKHLRMANGGKLTLKDQIGLDKIDPARKLGVRYPRNPNLSAYILADKILKRTEGKVDVVISDSDSGGKKGIRVIGCPTIIATPIGATKGIRMFYCMRAAVAGDCVWNNVENIPALRIIPYQASRIRIGIGELRYNGFINASREEDVLSIIK